MCVVLVRYVLKFIICRFLQLFVFLWNLKNRLHKALQKGSHRRAERDKRLRARI